MAAVSVPPSPQALPSTMSSRRVPLANVPNAANSPYRAVAAAAASKRSRSQSSVQRELPYGQAPPAKKLMYELNPSNSLEASKQQQLAQSAEGRVFTKRSTNSQPTAFERRLVAARDKAVQLKTAKNEKIVNENLETIRQWQKHYRKVFPHFTFFFESIPEDIRVKCSKQIKALGAQEEKFFSKAVTHVVTTRPIPPELDAKTAANLDHTPAVNTAQEDQTRVDQPDQPRTIDPSLLERSSDATHAQSQASQLRCKFTFEAPLGRKIPTTLPFQDAHSKKQQGSSGDVLHRAREMGMKIWALEKFQRMMTTLFDTDTGSYPQHTHNTRGNAAATAAGTKLDALSVLLRNEKLKGPADRDPTVSTKELIHFRGPFIYIHDMEEKNRPIMVREYPKVAHREDGEWPQFRSVGNGRCPFIHDGSSKRDREKERARLREVEAQKRLETAPKTRAVTALEASRQQSAVVETEKRDSNQVEPTDKPTSKQTPEMPSVKLFEPPKAVPAKRGSLDRVARESQPTTYSAFGGLNGLSRLHGGEPVASGVQPSNITSAIRSQMISSTAAAPGAKAGTSKEVQELKRKVLERNSVPSANSVSSSFRVTDAAAAAAAAATTRHSRPIPQTRLAKRKPDGIHDELGDIEEEPTPSEEEEAARRQQGVRKFREPQRRVERKEPKPGYCENCREKFDDFDEHTFSRRHRRFALSLDNWAELDALLAQLDRPLKGM
ncbi:hypothetical protein L228DRAFT_284177 [Xylona heveae TC161]|uniref:DBF4-type domain-containing protein n=1 Tax=Xylona heveae (strain CBS 132557 / TC161) TaxID=1328760 RepID=A0A165FL69_XYLHT|nr:hypothetical protein L228DRAFT_284177 [Xylona heveae TC161]KZF21106.1 hypothetical protein L228DRAFT_284177 [Xylona heveae TC161]